VVAAKCSIEIRLAPLVCFSGVPLVPWSLSPAAGEFAAPVASEAVGE
jgi:hypothetical protein